MTLYSEEKTVPLVENDVSQLYQLKTSISYAKDLTMVDFLNESQNESHSDRPNCKQTAFYGTIIRALCQME